MIAKIGDIYDGSEVIGLDSVNYILKCSKCGKAFTISKCSFHAVKHYLCKKCFLKSNKQSSVIIQRPLTIGRKYASYTILEFVVEKNKYKCQCDCGDIVFMGRAELIDALVCPKANKYRVPDKIGNYIIIRSYKSATHRNRVYDFRCVRCGRIRHGKFRTGIKRYICQCQSLPRDDHNKHYIRDITGLALNGAGRVYLCRCLLCDRYIVIDSESKYCSCHTKKDQKQILLSTSVSLQSLADGIEV